MNLKNFKLSAELVFLIAIGSCAAGQGLEASEYVGWGTALRALGTGLIFYLICFKS